MTFSRKIWHFVFLAYGLAFALTANAQLFGGDEEARRRIETLRQQVETNQRTLDERLGKIEQSSSAAADRTAILDLSSQLDSLRNDMAKLRGQIEVLTNQIETASQRQKDLYLDIDTRLRKLETAREQAAANPPPEKPAAAATNEASPAETRAYQAALD